jgi:hypothetical protein
MRNLTGEEAIKAAYVDLRSREGMWSVSVSVSVSVSEDWFEADVEEDEEDEEGWFLQTTVHSTVQHTAKISALRTTRKAVSP